MQVLQSFIQKQFYPDFFSWIQAHLKNTMIQFLEVQHIRSRCMLYCSSYCLRYFTNTRAWGREASVYRCIYLYKKQYLYYNIFEIFIIIKPVIERYASLQIYIYRKNNVSIINLNISIIYALFVERKQPFQYNITKIMGTGLDLVSRIRRAFKRKRLSKMSHC